MLMLFRNVLELPPVPHKAVNLAVLQMYLLEIVLCIVCKSNVPVFHVGRI